MKNEQKVTRSKQKVTSNKQKIAKTNEKFHINKFLDIHHKTLFGTVRRRY